MLSRKSYERILACLFFTVLLAACGVQDETQEYRSELLGVSGTGEHEICASDVNVRDPQDIGRVLFVASSGERVLPQGRTQSHIGYTFHLLKFKSSGKTGWVANDYVCTVGTQNLGAPKIDVNLTTNRLTFYRGTTEIRSWNIASARAGKITPTGTFKILSREKCPRYFGADGGQNVPGCSPANPLGTRALWWQDTMYGLHGTNQPALIAEGTTANARRLSAGCIRNLNAHIEWLYDQVKTGDTIVIHR